MGCSMSVSIPHRQAKNRHYSETGYQAKTLFQFLIGRLKTRDGEADRLLPYLVSIPHRQAKNGMSLCADGLILMAWFQFLIGRLKTASLKEWKEATGFVSIPHRQAKNSRAAPRR
ncbi:hypothetical protein PTH_1902 [Pelotomaculum thermopropionicum SI]|uniref:Uncharacterized protein n=1 Tax=Pelotomaculum thermopropionicum (strain DSM 13744 / JCM 10971 / SI) TaxID=370438 RepID=A5D106_PELTS|nr:hypothetical protein PTH_1902 [Pelotomaculum thermopropionicum SI]